jgi:hypothetical protein
MERRRRALFLIQLQKEPILNQEYGVNHLLFYSIWPLKIDGLSKLPVDHRSYLSYVW